MHKTGMTTTRPPSWGADEDRTAGCRTHLGGPGSTGRGQQAASLLPVLWRRLQKYPSVLCSSPSLPQNHSARDSLWKFSKCPQGWLEGRGDGEWDFCD